MIEHIKNIGAYVKENYPEKNTIDGMINRIENKNMKTTLLINVTKDGIDYDTRDFEKDIVYDSLFYQAGNGAEGGGVRLDFYEQLNSKGVYKGRAKLKKACTFCEVGKKYEEIQEYVEQYLQEKDKNTFVVIQVEDKMPRELFIDKFSNKMYESIYKGTKEKCRCHLCGKVERGYNTTTYKFYTNDKGIYDNVEGKEKTGIVICKDCLDEMILGKKYIEEYLSTFWGIVGQKVMFIPHRYDVEAAAIYESTNIRENKGVSEKIKMIKINEEDLVDEIGRSNTTTDIIFYEDDSKFFYINHQIQSIAPTRFTKTGEMFAKYELKLFTIIKYMTAIKVSIENIEVKEKEKIKSTEKEKMKALDAIFTGRKINRSIFFERVMKVYKYYYLRDEHRKFACMKSINRIYNFLCECNCLEKGWNVLKDYRNYDELFEENNMYFDLNEKKAWFILGRAYNQMIYFIQLKNKGEEDVDKNDKTSLEKTFFFARKFDFNDFIYFSNLLKDKSIKYRIKEISKVYFEKMLTEAKNYMAKKENKLSIQEAKYIFFWGMDAYFKKEVTKQEQEIEKSEEK